MSEYSHLADSDVGGPKGKPLASRAMKWREDRSRPSKKTGVRDYRSRELGSSQGKGPSIGCSKSRGTRTRATKW
jgi:hypothetical protein